MRTGSLSFYFVTLCLAALGSIHYFLNRGKVGIAYLVRVRGGRGWKGSECSRLRELQQGQRHVVGSTAIDSRIQNKVSVMRCFLRKCCLSICLCVGSRLTTGSLKMDRLISASQELRIQETHGWASAAYVMGALMEGAGCCQN